MREREIEMKIEKERKNGKASMFSNFTGTSRSTFLNDRDGFRVREIGK